MRVYELLKYIPEAKIVFFPKADETVFDPGHAFLYKPFSDYSKIGTWTNFGIVRRKEKLEESILECRRIRNNKYLLMKRYRISNDNFTADTILNAEVEAIHTSYSETKENTAYLIVVIRDIVVSDANAENGR